MLDGLKLSAKRTPKKERRTIPRISAKKRKRLAETGGEAELFRKVWEERAHFCEVCGEMIPEPKAECFAHRLGK